MSNEITSPQVKTREFEEIRIPVPWGHIAGRWYGNRNDRPILALHGWLDNYGTWDTLVPLLPSHIAVLAIDLPGHGESSHLPRGIVYHGRSYLADILRVMQHYNWDRISIMAHSMSSIIAFLFAGYYPERVDMLIQLDAIHPHYHSPQQVMWYIRTYVDGSLLEEQRFGERHTRAPPSYSYEDVVQRVHLGSNNSVDLDKCKHLIRTSVAKSSMYPSRYYFSSDPRVKTYVGFFESFESLMVMAKRIKIPQLVIKASRSITIDEPNDPLFQVLRDNNPYFEFHIVEGTHHVHLNNAPETNIVVSAFINKWKPPLSSPMSQAVVGEDENGLPVDGSKPQPQICPMKPQGASRMSMTTTTTTTMMQKAKL